MLFGNDRSELRRLYTEAWRKRGSGQPLSALEDQIARVIEAHPEYQPLMSAGGVEREFDGGDGQSNPFLHMGLHLAVRDQVATDRPAGIRAIFERLAQTCRDAHAAEHRMIDCLAETLWEAQRAGSAPDETLYLERLHEAAGR